MQWLAVRKFGGEEREGPCHHQVLGNKKGAARLTTPQLHTSAEKAQSFTGQP